MSDWYYAESNEQKGPINESELKANFATNKLPPDTLVWKDGMENWTPANQVPAFSFRPPPAPAKVQPPAAGTVAAGSTAPAAAAMTSAETPAAVSAPEPEKIGAPVDESEIDDAEKNKIFGILSYVFIFWFLPLVVAKDSAFAKFHANQGLALFLVWVSFWVVLWIIGMIFSSFMPGSFGFIYAALNLVYIAPLALLVMGIYNAAMGKCTPLPVIGGLKLL